MTEETDALSIAVSEERGEISLSLRGRIERGLSPDDLRARLQHLLLPKRARGDAAAAAEVDA